MKSSSRDLCGPLGGIAFMQFLQRTSASCIGCHLAYWLTCVQQERQSAPKHGMHRMASLCCCAKKWSVALRLEGSDPGQPTIPCFVCGALKWCTHLYVSRQIKVSMCSLHEMTGVFLDLSQGAMCWYDTQNAGAAAQCSHVVLMNLLVVQLSAPCSSGSYEVQCTACHWV